MGKRVAAIVFLALIPAFPLSGRKNLVSPECVEPGCVITLHFRAMFTENQDNLIWEYSPKAPEHGIVKFRGTGRTFLVVEVQGEKVLASGDRFFAEDAHVFGFTREELQNQKIFQITD